MSPSYQGLLLAEKQERAADGAAAVVDVESDDEVGKEAVQEQVIDSSTASTAALSTTMDELTL